MCVPFQRHSLHTVLQPFRRIELMVHIDTFVLPGTNLRLIQVKHIQLKCFAKIETMSQRCEEREKHLNFSIKPASTGY